MLDVFLSLCLGPSKKMMVLSLKIQNQLLLRIREEEVVVDDDATAIKLAVFMV